VTLASIGLPGTNGFVGEFLILSGSFVSKIPGGKIWAGFAATGVILGAVYMLWLYQRMWQGKVVHEENRSLRDLSFREWAIVGPLVVLIFVMGLFPSPFLGIAKPSVERWVGQLEKANPAMAGDPAPSAASREQRRAEAPVVMPAPTIQVDAKGIDPSVLRAAQRKMKVDTP